MVIQEAIFHFHDDFRECSTLNSQESLRFETTEIVHVKRNSKSSSQEFFCWGGALLGGFDTVAVSHSLNRTVFTHHSGTEDCFKGCIGCSPVNQKQSIKGHHYF